MKKYSLWIGLAMLICAAVAIVFAAPSTLAYLSANTNTLRNSFSVKYLPPQDITVPVRIHKSVMNLGEEAIGPGGFGFHLLNADTGEVTAYATSSPEGLAAMNLVFTAEDLDKTYRFRLCEWADGRKYVIYDQKVYDISISLVLNEIHEMSAECTVNGQPVTEIAVDFENKYDVPAFVPLTGDQSCPMLWLSMLVFSAAGLIMLKRRGILAGGCNGAKQN